MEKITSLQLYLYYPAAQVVETKCLEDVCCGIYPCYYLRHRDKLKVSTSVTSLILDSKVFKLNSNFKPPNFLKQKSKQKLSSKSLWILKGAIKRFFIKLFLNNLRTEQSWYEMWETIDKRVHKLRPFERVTHGHTIVTFKPDFTIRDKKMLINKTINHLQDFIHSVENVFPDYNHIIMTGGKDSQLISLIPKLDNVKWHIFCAEPNYPLVKRWIEENGVNTNKMFRHDNRNEETIEDLKKKIVCGDLYSDPRHIRWMPSLKEVADRFDYKCIFWAGTTADTIYSFHEAYHNESQEGYFKVHKSRACSWQGNYHQIFKNFVGCPLLSPYHSKEIWEELYQHLAPSIITKDTDLRNEIGEKLFGKSVKWLAQNPGPDPYDYDFSINMYRIYIGYIEAEIAKR